MLPTNLMELLEWTVVATVLLLVAGCETVIDVDLPESESVLVAHAGITPEIPWSVGVTNSVDVLGLDRPSVVSNAVVEVHRGGDRVESLSFENGRYVGTTHPQAGASYTLHVAAPGYAPIVAEDYVPIPVDAAVSSRSQSFMGPHPSSRYLFYRHTITIHLNDPPGIRNFYALSIEITDTIGAQSGWRRYEHFETRDAAIVDQTERVGIDDETGTVGGTYLTFSDAGFDGRSREIVVWFTEYVGGSDRETIKNRRLRIGHLSEAYFKYARSLDLYKSTRDNPFAEPAHVFSNVENGYGIFAGYSESAFDLEPVER